MKNPEKILTYRVAVYLTIEEYTYLVDLMCKYDRSLSWIIRDLINKERNLENEIN